MIKVRGDVVATVRSYELGSHADDGIIDQSLAPPASTFSNDGTWRVHSTHLVKFPYPRLLVVWVRDLFYGETSP